MKWSPFDMVSGIAGKKLGKRHIDGPTCVRGRNSDNRLIREKLKWAPATVLVVAASVSAIAGHDEEQRHPN
jgi:hypothetical protein